VRRRPQVKSSCRITSDRLAAATHMRRGQPDGVRWEFKPGWQGGIQSTSTVYVTGRRCVKMGRRPEFDLTETGSQTLHRHMAALRRVLYKNSRQILLIAHGQDHPQHGHTIARGSPSGAIRAWKQRMFTITGPSSTTASTTNRFTKAARRQEPER